jgi:ATP-dependent RNA helicase DDX54/DBP10
VKYELLISGVLQDTLHKVCKNGYRQYLKSRPNASTESNRRAKDIEIGRLPVHPIFEGNVGEDPMNSLISRIQGYRPHSVQFF